MRALTAVLCACALLLSLSGCRYSDTLLEIINDPDTGILDPNATALYQEVPGAPIRDDLASLHLAENENFADQANFLPVYKEDAGANGQAVRRYYDAQTPDDYDAVEGDEPSEQEDANTSQSEEQTEGDDLSSGDTSDATEQQTSDDGDGTQADKKAGRGGRGQVYGDDDFQELPDARCVAATGQCALIAQMLGGKGALGATDAAFVSMVQQKGIFPGEGVADIPQAWDANGNLNMEALIASDADVILTDGVDLTFTDAQKEALLEEGFSFVSMPHLGESYTADADILQAVKRTGQVLSGLNSEATRPTAEYVESYLAFHDDVINECVKFNGGYSYKMENGHAFDFIYQNGMPGGQMSHERITTACIDSMVSASSPTMTAKRDWQSSTNNYLHDKLVDMTDGVGLSQVTVGESYILSDYYLQVAGVVNNAYYDAKPAPNVPYAVCMGSSEGVATVYTGPRNIPSALWYSQIGINFTDDWTIVGAPTFPGVIVRDADIAQKIVKSASKTNGFYNVGQPYKIYQAPAGVAGNWLDGTVESFLTAPWAFDVFGGHDPATARDYANSFYSFFYRTADGASLLEGFGSTLYAASPTS